LTNAKLDASSADAKQQASEFSHAAAVATASLTDESGTQQLQVRKNKDTYYAKSTAVEGAYKIESGLGKALEKNVDDFRDKKLFDFGYNDPEKIELHNANKSYFLTRGTAGADDWWSNGKKIDGANVESVVSDLRDLTATGFSASGFSTPTINISVVSEAGKHTEKVEIAKSGDHYIARRENDPTLYELGASAVDDLLKAAQDLKPTAPPVAQKKP
jgi:hypothetical protein